VAARSHTTNHKISRRTAARKLTAFIEQATFRFGRQKYRTLLAEAVSSLNECFRVDNDQSTDAVNQLG
jgi:hypothetical protein